MPSRAERRRQSRNQGGGRPSWLSALAGREVIAAVVLGLAVVGGTAGVLLLTGGDGGSDGPQPPGQATAGPSFSPGSDDEAAIETLARKSIEVMPRNQWPGLYDDFTAEFQSRCPREQFVQAGIDAAREQGANLTKLGYVRLEDVSVQGEAATATIIGEVKGAFEYKILAAFQKQDGAWKLAPASGTSGCQAFNRP